jgi:hypothetical protein
MIVIFRCLHCGAQIEGRYQVTDDKRHALNLAYNRATDGPIVYTQHPCDDHTLGVAQLIAARDE